MQWIQSLSANSGPTELACRIAPALGRPDFSQELVDRPLTTVAADRVQRILMPLRRIRGAGVGDQRDEVTLIAGVADGAFDALVGDDAADDEIFRAEIAEHVVNVGR